MEQVIIGGYQNSLNITNTEYNRLSGAENWGTVEHQRGQLVSTDGKLKNLRVELNDVPGTGTYVFTVKLNGNPTTLTCEVAADGIIASDTTHEVIVTGGDRVNLECNPDSPDTARYARWTVMFEGDNAKESLILGGTQNYPSLVIIEYGRLSTPAGSHNWGPEPGNETICPTAGKIKNLYVELNFVPGIDPQAFRITLRKGNGAMASTPLTVTITGNNTKGSNLVDEVTVAAGDVLTLMCEPLNTPEDSYILWGTTFVADIDGESIILGGIEDEPHDSNTEYTYLTGAGSGGVWNITEAQRSLLAQSCVLKKLHVRLEHDPDPGSYTFTLRKPGNGAAAGNLTVTITTGNTEGNDVAHTDEIFDGDMLGFESVPADVPTEPEVYWGLVSYIEPPAAGLENKSANMGSKMVAAGLI